MGEVPSPTITAVPVAVFEVGPLTAEMAPASIRLAKTAIIVFVMVYFSLLQYRDDSLGSSIVLDTLMLPKARGTLKSHAMGKRGYVSE
jgi:hypothetical protein